MRGFWCRHAWLPQGPVPDVRFNVAGGRIVTIETSAGVRPDDTVLSGLVMPGFANAHSHTFHRALRGISHAGDSFWTWRDTMYRVAARLDPDLLYAFAHAAYTEMLASGYTVVGEFHYVHHRPDGTAYADSNAMGTALIAAAHDVGIRLTLLDALYLSAGFGAPLEPAQRRFGDGGVKGWIDRVDRLPEDDFTRIGAAVHSIRAVDPAQAAAVAAWARAAERPIHIHLSEQPLENEGSLTAYGLTPAVALDRVGFWGPDTTAVHATHLSAADIAALGSAHTAICICPSTEADLADGVPPLPQLLAAGATIAIGSDQNVLIDGLREVQDLESAQRLLSGTREHLTSRQLVQALSEAGHDCLGWRDAGRLRTGALADFTVVRTDSLRTAGCEITEVPRYATREDVSAVYVGGVNRTRPTALSEAAEALGTLARKLRKEQP